MSSEENKSCPKKRSNLNEAGINSEDEEPIGTLIKLKKRKIPKKVKTDGSDHRGKGVVGEEKFVAAKEDMGGMEDTLAIFRKKLKGPKKGNKSGIKSAKSKGADAEELSGNVFTVPAQNILEVSEDDKGSINQSEGQSVSKKVKKCKIKRSKAAHKPKKVESNVGLFSYLDDQRCQNSFKEASKLCALKSSEEFRTSPIDSLEASLSSMFLKPQGVKTRCPSGLLQERESKAALGTSSEPFADVKPVGATISGCKDMDRRMGDDEDGLVIDTSKDKNKSPSCHNEVQMNRGICDNSVDNMLGEKSCIITNSSMTAYVGREDKVHGLKGESEGLSSLNEEFVNVKTHNPCLNQERIPECRKLKGALESNDSERNLHEISCSRYTSRQVEEANQSDENAPILEVGDAVAMKPKEFLSMNLNDSSGRASQEIYVDGDSLAIAEKVVNKLKFHPSQKAPLKPKLLSSCSAFGRDKKEESLSDYDGSNKTKILWDSHVLETERREVELDLDKVPGIKQFYSQKDDASVCTVQNQPSDQVHGPTFAPSDEGSVEATGNSSPSNTPDMIGVVSDEKLHKPNTQRGNSKKSSVQRTTRKIKKRRHGDMAYEGDADWEMLINGYGFFENRHVEGGQSTRRRHKSNLPAGVVAAVSAGLKARAADPIEKIKFKEVFKRKGGLQEYLECRNHILDLWSKNLNSFLSLEDCGVIAIPSTNESPNVSLVREIYMFLNQYGFINFGIASGKGRGETLKILKILHEKNQKVSNDQVTDLDGASAIPVLSLEVNNGGVFNDESHDAGALKDGIQLPEQINELSSQRRSDASQDDETDDTSCPDKIIGTMLNMDAPTTDKWSEELNNRTVPVISSTDEYHFDGDKSAPNHHFEGSVTLQNDSKEKRRIIVIGAGPAGLSAARHLQRQGYIVDILEARSRIGGRVYTDCSSLSVPVDLGASIITGVEADVATERRPDPSSLVCAQLGLELTVLNSDCPLFDIVTGKRVPTDLDEALESEYNSLLDDMVLLIAHKRDQAMRMSLEDGLDYVLKRRRFGRNQVEKLMVSTADPTSESDKFNAESYVGENNGSKEEILSPLEKRVMDWHFAHLEYGCAAPLNQVSLPHWNQDDAYGGFGGAHCMIKGGYSSVVEALSDELSIHLDHVVEDISYFPNGCKDKLGDKVKVVTSAGREFSGDAVLITVPLGCLKAKTINFMPPLPDWKQLSIQRLGFGVLNKVVLEFPEVFWDDSVDYFGATAEGTNERGHCFMFWNVKKTVGAPVLISLVVGKAAIDGQNNDPFDHVNRALTVLRKLFGEASVPDPVASVVTDWGRDPFSYGAYSYVAIGASGEDYDILGRPVENCLFFAGEATCKEHPDTVGGAMLSGLREAVRIMDILSSGNDYTAEVEAMEASQRQLDNEKNEVRDLVRRLDSVELSNALYKKSLDGEQIFTRGTLLQDMFCNAKTTAGRLHLAKELLKLPIDALKAFAGTKEGLGILNSWILDSMGKDGTQLLRHCVRLLVIVSTDLGAVRLSGIGRTVKEKVCVHTSRDIRAIASQLVNVWIEVFRKEKASNGGLKLLRQTAYVDSSKNKSSLASVKARSPCLQVPTSDGALSNADMKRESVKPAAKLEKADTPLEVKPSKSQSSSSRQDTKEDENIVMSEEERAAIEAAEAAKAKAVAAAEAYASAEAKRNTSMPLPKILSFHKFARREQYAQMDESEFKRKWPGGAVGRQDCLSEIDSRNCKVRDWSVDFSAACPKLDSSKMIADDLSRRSHSNELSRHPNLREHSAESAAADTNTFTKSWIDASGSVEAKDNDAIERWQSQAAAAGADLHSQAMQVMDEEESNLSSKVPNWKHKGLANESSVSQVTLNKELVGNQPREPDRIKQAVVDYVASLLMPLYKAKKISRESYKSIMKKAATKVMEQATDADKAMAVHEFLDFKCKNKIRVFVDLLIAKHMGVKPTANS